MSARQALLEAACELALETDAARSVRPHKGAYRRLATMLEIGQVKGDQLILSALDRRVIAQWLTHQGIDPRVGVPKGLGRTELAAYQIDEKRGAEATARRRQLVGLAGAGDRAPAVDGYTLEPGTGGFYVLRADRARGARADWLLTVENFDTFLILCEQPEVLDREGAGLLVFRTSPSLPAGLTWAKRTARAQRIPWWHAPDVDPSGLLHATETGLAGAWLPVLDGLETLPGNRAIFDAQARYTATLLERVKAGFPALTPWAELILARRVGFTQESAMAFGVPYVWLPNGR